MDKRKISRYKWEREEGASRCYEISQYTAKRGLMPMSGRSETVEFMTDVEVVNWAFLSAK